MSLIRKNSCFKQKLAANKIISIIYKITVKKYEFLISEIMQLWNTVKLIKKTVQFNKPAKTKDVLSDVL